MRNHWWLRVYANRKRQRVDLTALFPTEPVDVAAARAKDLALKGLLVDGELVASQSGDTRLTFGDVADHYVKARGGKQYYLVGIRAVEVPASNGGTVKLEAKPIDDVTTADIKYVVTVWRSRKRTKAGVRGGSVAERHLKQTARHFFNWAIEEGYATRTPFYSPQGRPLIHISTKGHGRKRRLEEREEDRILEAADPFIKDFFQAMIETGCRPGELRTLQWSEVKGDHFVVLASKAKDREKREIPIEPTLRAILDRRRLGPDGEPLAEAAYVFGNETGEMFGRRDLNGWWCATCKAAKVEDLHLHDLRREFASQLIESAVPIHAVRDALGHSNTTMTSSYLGLARQSLKQAYKQRSTHRARQGMKRVV